MDTWTDTQAYRIIFWMYALLGLVKFGLSLMLSTACEPEPKKPERSVTGMGRTRLGVLAIILILSCKSLVSVS